MNISDKNFNFLTPLVDIHLSTCNNLILIDLLRQTRKLTDFFSFQICPGASKPTLHHFYAGGLQQHIYEIVTYGLNVLSNPIWPFMVNETTTIDKEETKAIFTIAAIWHDVGKVYDYRRTYSKTFLKDSIDNNGLPTKEAATQEYYCTGLCLDERKIYENCYRSGMVIKKGLHGKLVSHLSRSYYEFTKTAVDVLGSEAMTNIYVMLIQNAILAHHGRYEFGSPKEPENWLSILLHQADYFSANCSPATATTDNEVFVPFNIAVRDDEAEEKKKKSKK